MRRRLSMPRLHRIRIHNIHFDSGGQSRYFHDSIFEPRGLNSLLLLSNGGGKTLLLHLIAQVVLPNVRLQERRISRLVEKEKFTGHVMVEWRLDGEMPHYLLTGFCFAESLGNANREMDYFNYIYSYTDKNSWDIASIPLVDEAGRNLNFKQLNDMLRDSPVSLFHSYRKQEYQAKLKSYNIEPREWEHVLRINNSEGGVEDFFEGCSKTRTLMHKLLIPMIDEVLERNEQRDSLQDAFRKVARQAIELPELKVQSDALGELSQRIPRLNTSFAAVALALQLRNDLRVRQGRIQLTLVKGLPRLERELGQLDKVFRKKGAEVETANFMVEAYTVERYRREWVKMQAEHLKQTDKLKAAQKRCEDARQYYDRLLANQQWTQILGKRSGLAECEQQLEKAKAGDARFHQRFDHLKKETLPLLQQKLKELEQHEARAKGDLRKLEDEAAGIAETLNRSKERLEGIERRVYHLHQKTVDFTDFREHTAAYFKDLNIQFDTYVPAEALRQTGAELKKGAAKLKGKTQEIEAADGLMGETRDRLAEARNRTGDIERELQACRKSYGQWCDQGQELQAELRQQGFSGTFPGKPEIILPWLTQKEKIIKQEYNEYQKEQRHWQEQQDLFGGVGVPRPNLEVDRVTEILRGKEIAAQPAVELLQDYPEEERQGMLITRPWLPYAVIVEPAHLVNLKRRPPAVTRELAVPVPLISREEFHHGSELKEIYFLSHRGLELFISEEKADTYRRKIQLKLDETAEKLKELDGGDQTVRRLQQQVALFLKSYAYASEPEWEKGLRNLEKDLIMQGQERDRLEGKVAECKQHLDGLKSDQEELQERKNNLARALDYGGQYFNRWQTNEVDQRSLHELNQQKTEVEVGITALEKEEEEHALLIRELKTKIESLHSRCEEYYHFRATHYSEGELTAVSAVEGLPDARAGKQLAEALQQITAMHVTLQHKQQDVSDLYKRKEEYKKDIEEREREIKRLGFEPSDVEAKYYPIKNKVIEEAETELNAKEQALEEVKKKCNDAGIQAEKANAVYKHRLDLLQKTDREVPNLEEFDLPREQVKTQELIEKLNREREGLQKDIKKCSDWIEDYNWALSIVKNVFAGLIPDLKPLSIEEERESLTGRARIAVEENREAMEQACNDIVQCKKDALAAFKICQTESLRLHGDDIKRFFYSLQQRTDEADWAERVGELQGQLQHALVAIERLQEHVQQLLSNIDKRIEEMAMRTWRHVDSLLEQFKELHRRARIELRGEKLNLFQIEFVKPDESGSKITIKDYLHRMVEEAARRHQQADAKEEVDLFLDEAVGSSQLLDQVVPLDTISIRLLKPGEFEGSYLRKQYDRWDHLSDWSQGQRFAGRFSLFVVLLSYLRHSRSGGRDSSSVILADNPFGKASSSHILEIINLITHHQNVQLFCCTALRNTEILREFPVIYSLVPAPTMSGKERMQLETAREPAPQPLDQAHAYIPGINPGDAGQLKIF